ncbi:MAG: hypothetical protein ACOCZ6_02760 [Nanoarchaeota archaeon]
MEETMHDARQELKRVDHLIYVSLKYTRTADVLKNVIERLVSSFDNMVLTILLAAKEKEMLEEVSKAPLRRYEQIKETFPEDKTLLEMADFYVYLRKLNKLDYGSENEYRRHVAMLFEIEEKKIKFDIDTATEYYKRAKEFANYIESNFIKND